MKDIILDPGFGFGKGIEENYSMLDILPLLKQTFAMPVMVGISRKRMIFNVLNITQDEALAGTIAANTVALTKGADIIRVHDVKEAVQTVRIFGHTGKLNVCN